MSTLVIVIIVLALVFDYINGFHDAANSIATVVSTKVLTPLQAVLWAAMFNFVAFFIFKDHAVANTIAKTVIDNYITLPVILAGLIAAIFWNLFFIIYVFFPRTAHRIVGYFEEEAVYSYTEYLREIDSGKIPNTPAPQIAIDYWKLGQGATLRDVVIAVREDEAKHRDVNHQFADEYDQP